MNESIVVKERKVKPVDKVLDEVDFDWRAIAGQRLDRLVETEHKYALLMIRHEALQVDHRNSIFDDVARLRRIRILEQQRDVVDQDVITLQSRLMAQSEVLSSVFASRSWRVTKPLRAIVRWKKDPRRAVKTGLLLVARFALVRRCLRTMLGSAPGLRARVEAFMYTKSP